MDETKEPESYYVPFDATGLASGVYLSPHVRRGVRAGEEDAVAPLKAIEWSNSSRRWWAGILTRWLSMRWISNAGFPHSHSPLSAYRLALTESGRLRIDRVHMTNRNPHLRTPSPLDEAIATERQREMASVLRTLPCTSSGDPDPEAAREP